jgi:heme-degrading monooxygenase HmoA
MAWGFRQQLPVSRDQYDQVNGEITEDPPGLILHTAAETGGGIQIVDVWESEDAFRRFERETLGPALGAAGVDTSGGPPPLEGYEVFNMRGPGAGS